jgi:hypothetical protein
VPAWVVAGGEDVLPMSLREERCREIRRLRDEEGLLFREIGERLGLNFRTVADYYNDPDGSKVRARKAKMAGSCEVCGARTSYVTGGVARFCPEHGSLYGGRVSGERLALQAMPRKILIEEMWHQGASLKEIAEVLGTTRESLSVTMVRMRRDPRYDVPYRYRVKGGRRVAS